MGKSKSTQTTNQTQTTKLPSFQENAAKGYFDELMRQFNETGLQREAYQGDLVAGLTPDQIAGQDAARTFATGQGQNYANRAIDTSSYLLDPNNILDPSRIPGVQASREALIRDVTRNLTENILPQTRTGALLTGAYGGSNQGNQDALAAGRTSEAITGALANQDTALYSQGLQAMLNALQLAPQTADLGLMPARTLQAIGAQNQTQNQNEIDAEVRRHEFTQNEPLAALERFQQLVGTSGMYGGTTTGNSTTTNTSKPSTLQTLGTIASIAAIPYTGGASAAALPGLVGSGQPSIASPGWLPSVSPSNSAVLPAITQVPQTVEEMYGRSLAPVSFYQNRPQ